MAIPREVGKQSQKLTNTRELREFKQTLHLSQLQKDFLFGTILGDGCLITSRSGRSARLQVRQNKKYKEYVIWKLNFFKDWVRTQPKEDPSELMGIKKLFYQGSKRLVPENISEFLKSPLSLAVWSMDDGNGYGKVPAFRLNTYGFGLNGNVFLQKCLRTNFHLETTIYNDSKGYVLYFRKRSAKDLFLIIEKYILPCMQYKFVSLTP